MSEIVTPHRAWLAHLPMPWRAPALSLATERPTMLVGILWMLYAFLSGYFAMRGRADEAFGYGIHLLLVLTLGLGHGLVSRDRTGSRWLLWFQRPATPLGHYARSFALTMAVATALYWLWLLLLAAMFALHGHALPSLLASSSMTGPIWCVLLLSVLVAVSSVVRGFDSLFVIGWFFLTLMSRPALVSLDAPLWAIDASYYLLLPMDAAVALGEWLRGESPAPALSLWLHLVLNPLAWLSLAAWRIRHLSNADTT